MTGTLVRLSALLPWQGGHRKEFIRNLLFQIYYTFIQCSLMMAFFGLLSGVAIAFQSNVGLSLLGSHNQLGKILVLIVFRELAPLVPSLILIARSVTAISAEMATNKVQQEVEALNIMGISVYHYLMAPRVVSGMISLFCMATTFWAFALLGGWIGANLNSHFPPSEYLTSVAQSLRRTDFPFFITKTALIGGLVTWTAVKRGLSLSGAPFEVPIVTNRAVVDSLTIAIGGQALLTTVYYVLVGVDL